MPDKREENKGSVGQIDDASEKKINFQFHSNNLKNQTDVSLN